MIEQIFLRNSAGELVAWRRTQVRRLSVRESIETETQGADETFLERLIADRPELLGIDDAEDEMDIEGPFRPFRQRSVRALNGRTIAPDIVFLCRSGHVVVVEVKLADNPELRDRQVVAQLLEYAASLSQYAETELLSLFDDASAGAKTWADFVQNLFPDAPERLARRFLDKFRTGKLHLIIACDEAPRGLRELVRGVVGQHALGEYEFRVVEIAPYVSEVEAAQVMFLPQSILKTEIVSRSAVTIAFPEGKEQPAAVTVNVTPMEDVERRIREPQAAKVWTAAELEEAFSSLPGDGGQHFVRLLRWAVEHNCLLSGRTSVPVLGLKARSGKRLISFYPGWKPFSYLDAEVFGSPEVRDNFVRELQGLGLYAPEFSAALATNGKGLERNLSDLSNDEFERFFGILRKYCGESVKGVGA